MIELLLPCGFDTLEYSWVKATIDICTLVDYSVAKKHQHTQVPGCPPPAFSASTTVAVRCILDRLPNLLNPQEQHPLEPGC
jgi:hypothetical protein